MVSEALHTLTRTGGYALTATHPDLARAYDRLGVRRLVLRHG